ncbi:CLUMA_CG014336, isoform A [Clunio marinus]|uniref:CLUMA_CG014336, isoform A n=1 Tax=Clunio marinus TaxID=568069 RepID=A0A1J1IMB0_9DIPT|nr:CLUMA_CG014336, isoform A [Clunio marinus]
MLDTKVLNELMETRFKYHLLHSDQHVASTILLLS